MTKACRSGDRRLNSSDRMREGSCVIRSIQRRSSSDRVARFRRIWVLRDGRYAISPTRPGCCVISRTVSAGTVQNRKRSVRDNDGSATSSKERR